MTILLDNCVPRRYLQLIQGWGYPATLLSSHIASDSADIDVIALATKLDAALLTVDLDFANILDYPPNQYAGIIVLRYGVQEETILDTTLKSALDDMYREDLRNKLVINIGRQLPSAALEPRLLLLPC